MKYLKIYDDYWEEKPKSHKDDKLFEHTYLESDAEELVKQFDEDFIDDYFRENYSVDTEEIAKYYVDIWQYVDDDRFVDDWIEGEIESFTMRDISDKYEMRKYVKEKLIDEESVQKFLDKKRKKYQLETNDDYEDIVTELDTNDLFKLIEKERSSDDFVEWYIHRRYDNMDAHEILSELYGENDLRENGYNYVQNYVDSDRIKEDFYDNESDEYKSEWVRDRIENERELQLKLMEISPKNSILLLDVMTDDIKNSIGDEYEFQNEFMEEVIRLVKEEDYDEEYPAEQMKKLYDKFGLADGIEEKYKEYAYLVAAGKYNL